MKKITFKDMCAVLIRREFYLVFLYVPALPVILFLSLKIDKAFKFVPFVVWPWNIVLFLIFSGSGALIVWMAYAYLVLIGKGSPCHQLGGTNKLVTCGPYAWVRHPSVLGKLLFITGLGCLIRSTFFMFVVVPILLIRSLLYNRFVQERECFEKFGEDYLRYCKNVPMMIPSLRLGKAKWK